MLSRSLVLMTGTSMSGLGFEAAQTIAKYANLVIITGHNAESFHKTQSKKEFLVQTSGHLSSTWPLFFAVRQAAAEVNAYPEQIDILINNAASAICPFVLTADGFEQQIATDHLGPFLFTALIMPKILAAQTASYTPRVIYVASGAHAWGSGVNLTEMEHPNQSTYDGIQAYGQAKSANILTARELTRRAGGRVHAYSLTPGAIVTNFVLTSLLQNEDKRPELVAQGVITEDGKPGLNPSLPWKTLSQGAATIIAAAFDPSLNEKPGCYLAHSTENDDAVAPHSSNPDTAQKLWELSERLVGVKLF
ncbi:NAD(P)-binding protein [Mycena sanguinolenta]|uniref:NAD(P)-binding protein n=1 Tax=Mycena sanguinolenta TaxID=230812 RepID=A0A8H6ZIA6_9AGAR|nr:NAD(P)-binding protein [Mycena sanguinolenta]